MLTGLKVIHPGWWLGSIQKSRFLPSHALAMGIHPKDAQHVLDLHRGDNWVLNYLHGEAINEPGADGWILITIDDFPVGWGKRTQGIIKNFYPHGLRQLT
jgi:NOL1/NOP2/fmu family ribosome biogenesis protein